MDESAGAVSRDRPTRPKALGQSLPSGGNQIDPATARALGRFSSSSDSPAWGGIARPAVGGTREALGSVIDSVIFYRFIRIDGFEQRR